MSPALSLGGWEVPAYAALTVLALVAGSGLFGLLAVRRGISCRISLAAAAATLAGGLVGARLWAAATAAEPFFGSAREVFRFQFGNMAIFGGLLGAALGAGLAARMAGVPATCLTDAAGPALGVGIVLLRTGCLLAGCCFGKVTMLPWGITYPKGSLAHGYQIAGSPLSLLIGPQAVHPIPVYEMLAGAVLAGAALLILRRSRRDGTALAVVVGGYALVRLIIEPLRVPEPGSTPGWFDPFVFALVALAAAAWVALRRVRAKGRGAAHSRSGPLRACCAGAPPPASPGEAISSATELNRALAPSPTLPRLVAGEGMTRGRRLDRAGQLLPGQVDAVAEQVVGI